MAHKIAKLLLEQADTFLERTEAMRTALSLGMPLYEIEEYLDWLEASGLNRQAQPEEERGGRPSSEEKGRPMAG